ncbi:MAG: ribosomal protein S18-alanine N-acetyltransferase [Candidatus Gastranaerophilales bacterium]|nr:ribosomal protein S18-alanine N-acetyltransferase [Candidatus Gastranaerophilales bacterium]
MQNVTIQKMEADNIDDILAIEELCYGEHHWSYESFISELNNQISSYRCALFENKCIGYMGIWKIVDEAHVTNLSVHPDFQNKKVAHLLLLDSIDECYKNKIKFITLEVRTSNEKAIHLYEKFGFKSLGVRKKYYQDNNEDALIMWSENIFDKKYKELYDNIKKEITL